MLFNTLRSTAINQTNRTAKRFMGAAPKKEWTGADAVVRKYFPEDYQGMFVVVIIDIYLTMQQWQEQSSVSMELVSH